MNEKKPGILRQEWAFGWEGHRKQQIRDAYLYSTPEQRLQWLEDLLIELQLPLKKDYWKGPGDDSNLA